MSARGKSTTIPRYFFLFPRLGSICIHTYGHRMLTWANPSHFVHREDREQQQ